MQKTICRTLYDTENAALIRKYTSGAFGDADGYEESLYRTSGGSYFLYVNGGASSLHPKEDLKRLSAARAEQWLAEKV